MIRPTDAEKENLWRLYRERRAPRPPLSWGTNIRVCLLDPRVNTEGWTFEGCWSDPEAALAAGLRYADFRHDVLHRHSDLPTALPGRIVLGLDFQNVYDGAYFGGRVTFLPGQTPVQEPFLGYDDGARFLATPFEPEGNPFLRSQYERHARLCAAAAGRSHAGRPVEIAPMAFGFDGPVTAGAAIFGADFFALMGGEPELAGRILEKLTRDAIQRNRYMRRRAGFPERMEAVGFADDSIQLLSADTYRELVLPWHRLYYEEMGKPGAPRSIHLCGDATRHFPLIREALGVGAFDTGYPVDHGGLRKALGPDVEISGGPEVSLFVRGTPEAVAAETGRILASGVAEGGRFRLREGNNLPPRVSEAHLSAAYETLLRHPGSAMPLPA